jgi:hypothetical protein
MVKAESDKLKKSPMLPTKKLKLKENTLPMVNGEKWEKYVSEEQMESIVNSIYSSNVGTLIRTLKIFTDPYIRDLEFNKEVVRRLIEKVKKEDMDKFEELMNYVPLKEYIGDISKHRKEKSEHLPTKKLKLKESTLNENIFEKIESIHINGRNEGFTEERLKNLLKLLSNFDINDSYGMTSILENINFAFREWYNMKLDEYKNRFANVIENSNLPDKVLNGVYLIRNFPKSIKRIEKETSEIKKSPMLPTKKLKL